MTSILPASGESLSNAEETLRLTGVTVRFGGITALSQISLSARQGEFIGLIGPNGSGKTTMLNAITGFVHPSAGEVRICNVRSNRLTSHRRARMGLARTFQRAALFQELTVGEHLTLAHEVRNLWRRSSSGNRSDAEAEVAELLAQPPWLLAPDRPISNLSLGAIRIVELGMALTARPKILLLDEPLSGLDQIERAALADLLLDVRHRFGLTVVLVEHDVESVVRLAERLVVLDFGQKIADGPTATIIDDPKVRQAYFGGSEAK